MNNAVKYTPAGGAVTISAQALGSFCRVDVADTGPGIPEREQAEIFRRFFRGQGTRSAQGLGLGLCLARQIITMQGGYIKVTSRPGCGCVFSCICRRTTIVRSGQHEYRNLSILLDLRKRQERLL